MSLCRHYQVTTLLAASIICSVLFSGCSAAAPPAPSEPAAAVHTQVVEKIATQVVEKPVTVIATAAPAAAPEPTAAPAAAPTAAPEPTAAPAAPEPTATPKTTATSSPLPAFPWPPPLPSTSAVVPLRLLAGQRDHVALTDIDATLCEALDATGYYEKSYFGVPGGFALVTRLEQIEPDGKSKEPPDRWNAQIKPLSRFSLQAYIEALFTANPGRYRIIVFVVSDAPIAEKSEPVSRDEAQRWLSQGSDVLPGEVGERGLTETHRVTALIYQFEQPGRGAQAVLVVNDALPGRQHLEKAQLWAPLAR